MPSLPDCPSEVFFEKKVLKISWHCSFLAQFGIKNPVTYYLKRHQWRNKHNFTPYSTVTNNVLLTPIFSNSVFVEWAYTWKGSCKRESQQGPEHQEQRQQGQEDGGEVHLVDGLVGRRMNRRIVGRGWGLVDWGRGLVHRGRGLVDRGRRVVGRGRRMVDRRGGRRVVGRRWGLVGRDRRLVRSNRTGQLGAGRLYRPLVSLCRLKI